MKKISLLFTVLSMLLLVACGPEPTVEEPKNAMSGRSFVLDIKNNQMQHLHYLVIRFDDNSRGTYYKTIKEWDETDGKPDNFSYVIDNESNLHVTYTCDNYCYFEGYRYVLKESEFKNGMFTLTYQYLSDGNWYERIDELFVEK